jgi:hypothetical protein
MERLAWRSYGNIIWRNCCSLRCKRPSNCGIRLWRPSPQHHLIWRLALKSQIRSLRSPKSAVRRPAW